MENKLLEIDLNEADEYDFDDFTQNLEYELFEHKIEFPITLEAVASNWRGQTGYAEAENQSDLINKISSFDPSYVELCINTSNLQEPEIVDKDLYPLYFKIYTHDVPMGFRMNLKKYSVSLREIGRMHGVTHHAVKRTIIKYAEEQEV